MRIHRSLDRSTRSQGGVTLDMTTKRIGFRRVELIQEPLKEPDRYGKGTTFLFEINDVRMFIGGMSFRLPCSAGTDRERRVELDTGAQLPHAAHGRGLPRVAHAHARREPEHGSALGRRRVRARRLLRHLRRCADPH